MSNMITKIEELKEAFQRAAQDPGLNDDDIRADEILVEILSPLLDALDFRPGDAEIINDLLEDWVYSENHPAGAVLERWLGMARKMEKEEKR